MARRRSETAAKRRASQDERVSLKPLTYEEAVGGLFSVKPDPSDVETKDGGEGDDGEDG